MRQFGNKYKLRAFTTLLVVLPFCCLGFSLLFGEVLTVSENTGAHLYVSGMELLQLALVQAVVIIVFLVLRFSLFRLLGLASKVIAPIKSAVVFTLVYIFSGALAAAINGWVDLSEFSKPEFLLYWYFVFFYLYLGSGLNVVFCFVLGLIAGIGFRDRRCASVLASGGG